MLRLGLNLASTRLILGHGHEGHRAAGGVIGAFGEFLMGGETVIGLTIFLILVVINFVVITKGAGRIAGSRRALQPRRHARQADGDRRRSLHRHHHRDAGARGPPRQELEEESGFYGSMDGASKFVKGDAVAGAASSPGVNILVGLIIGIVMHGLPFAEAFRTYTVLTAGDGLVSQIPALIVSTARGPARLQGRCGGQDGRGAGRPARPLSQGVRHGGGPDGRCWPWCRACPSCPLRRLGGVCGFLAWRMTKTAEIEKAALSACSQAAQQQQAAAGGGAHRPQRWRSTWSASSLATRCCR